MTTNDELQLKSKMTKLTKDRDHHAYRAFEIDEFTLADRDNKFLHVIVKTKNVGRFEIRILKNPYKRREFRLKKKSKKLCSIRKYFQRQFKFEKLLYEEIKRYYLQKTPSFYQFKMLPENSTLDPPNTVFDCIEYMGPNFIKTIARDILKQIEKNEPH